MYKLTNSSMFDDGFMKLNDELSRMVKWADENRIKEAQEAGASFLVDKVRKLSKPRKTGKLLKSIDYEHNSLENSTDVGWGVYYGRIVENRS